MMGGEEEGFVMYSVLWREEGGKERVLVGGFVMIRRAGGFEHGLAQPYLPWMWR